jgi:hypothetical protein
MFHLKRKWQNCGTSRNQKQMLAFGHLQGMQFQKIEMNFIFLYTMHQLDVCVAICVVEAT